MKNKLVIIIVVVLIIGFGIFLISNSKAAGNLNGDSSKNSIQEITLSIKNHNYYPQTVKVKLNETVRIYLDASVTGCYRGFTLRDFGVSKYLPTLNDYVEFTPTKKGTFQFACSMGMGTGTLIVE
jgi:plastocyanin domain-containing protein